MAISYIPDAQRKLIRIDVSCLHIAYVFTSRLFLHCIYKMHATNGPVTWKKSGAVGHVPAILVARNASLDQEVEALSINKLCSFKRGANEIYVAYFGVIFSSGQEGTGRSNLVKFVWEFEMSIFEVLSVQTYPKGLDVLHFKTRVFCIWYVLYYTSFANLSLMCELGTWIRAGILERGITQLIQNG